MRDLEDGRPAHAHRARTGKQRRRAGLTIDLAHADLDRFVRRARVVRQADAIDRAEQVAAWLELRLNTAHEHAYGQTPPTHSSSSHGLKRDGSSDCGEHVL